MILLFNLLYLSCAIILLINNVSKRVMAGAEKIIVLTLGPITNDSIYEVSEQSSAIDPESTALVDRENKQHKGRCIKHIR
jgi:hypothetical protein